MSAKWVAVGLLFVAGAMNYADRTVVSVVLPLLRDDLKFSDVQMGSIGVFFLWTYALCMPLAGWVGDRFSRSRTITYSFFAWNLVTLGTAFVHTAPQFYATRVLMGIAECFYIPAAIALIAEHHAGTTRGTAMSIHLAGVNLGLIAGGTAAGYIGQHFGWRPAFLVFGCIGLVAAAATALLLKDVENPEAPNVSKRGLLTSLRELSHVPTFFVQLAQAMCLAVGVWIFLNWLPLYYTESFGFSLASSGFAGTFMPQFSSTLGILFGGWLSDKAARRNPRHRLLIQSLFYIAAAPCLLPFLGQPSYGWASAMVFSASLLRATGQANEDPTLCDVLPNRVRATAIAMMNAGQCFTGGLGVLLAGYLKSGFGLKGVFAGIALLMLAAAAICAFGYFRTLPQDLRKQQLRNPALQQVS